MKGKRKKGEDTSSETPEKKRASSGRLSGMLESMEKRGSPVNAHKVATAYFESFRKDRNIPDGAEEKAPGEDASTAVDTGVDAGEKNAVATAVSSPAKKASLEKKPPRTVSKAPPKDGDPFLTPSETKVYEVIYKVYMDGDPGGVRTGLKELRELSGLSDKTVRMAVHSLTGKLNIEVLENALGVYGRKYKVYGPEEVHKRRLERGLQVDPVTKKVLVRAVPDETAVPTAASSPVKNAVGNAVTTAVMSSGQRVVEVKAVFKRYAGELGDGEAASFSEKYAGVDMNVIEAAVILSVLKGKGRGLSTRDVERELGRLGGPLPEGYLEGLRDVWESLKKKA